MSNRITREDSLTSAILKIAQGNPGAINTLFELVNLKEKEGIIALCHLYDMKIYGWRIWVCFKDYCNKDLNKFYDCIISRDKEMLDLVKKEEKLMGVSEEQNRDEEWTIDL